MAIFLRLGFLLLGVIVAFAVESDKPIGAVSYRIESNPFAFFLQSYEKLVPLERTVLSLYTIRYTLGNREGGDRLAFQFRDDLGWLQPQNVQLRFDYSGSQVSFVDISVTQSSTLGQAYVIDGVIGQRYITVIVEALYTTRLQYIANIYGH